jgi:hypothetical protein
MPESNSNVEELRAQVKRVKSLLNNFRDSLGTPEAPKRLNQAKDALIKLEKMTPGAASPMQLENFFQMVGEGVVAAQHKLDEKSEAYLNTRPDFSQPSVFRIPKVGAEIQFAMESTQTEGFNIFVYGSQDTRQQSQQHKVSFDIIAAPPPPDIMQQLETNGIQFGQVFVANIDDREKIRKMLLDSISDPASATGNKIRSLTSDAAFRKILILRGKEHWILLIPGKEGQLAVLDTIRVGHDGKVDVNPTAAPKVYPPRYGEFFKLLLEFAQEQAKRLKSIEGKKTGGGK